MEKPTKLLFIKVSWQSTLDRAVNGPIQSVRAVIIKHWIFLLVTTPKFTIPVRYNGEIVIMFSVVVVKNDKCQWLAATDSSEKLHSILISTWVDVQYSTKKLFFCVLITLKEMCVASRIIHLDRSRYCQKVTMIIRVHALHHLMVKTKFIKKHKKNNYFR